MREKHKRASLMAYWSQAHKHQLNSTFLQYSCQHKQLVYLCEENQRSRQVNKMAADGDFRLKVAKGDVTNGRRTSSFLTVNVRHQLGVQQHFCSPQRRPPVNTLTCLWSATLAVKVTVKSEPNNANEGGGDCLKRPPYCEGCVWYTVRYDASMVAAGRAWGPLGHSFTEVRFMLYCQCFQTIFFGFTREKDFKDED